MVRIAIALVALVMSHLVALDAHATIVIDSFDDGAFSIQSGDPLLVVPASSAIGGARGVEIVERGFSDPTVGSLVDGDGYAEVQRTSTPASGNFNFHYGDSRGISAPLNLDLRGKDRFRVTVSVVSASMQLFILIDSQNSPGKTIDINGPGTYEVLFSDFSAFVDTSTVGFYDSLRFEFSAPGSANFRVDSLLIVPEPSTITLLVVGLVCLQEKRRRQLR